MGDFTPINTVTPFTYRDNDTYLTILRTLENKVNEVVGSINDESANNAGGLNAFKQQVNLALAALRAELVAMIEALETSDVAFDPTNGTRTEDVSTVLGRVYDNTRVYAWFAGQYDELNHTAAEYDALGLSARHFDLAATYPTINDVRTSS